MKKAACVALVLVWALSSVACRGIERQRRNVTRQLGSAAVRSLVRLTAKGSTNETFRRAATADRAEPQSLAPSEQPEPDPTPTPLVTRGRLPMDAAPGVAAPTNRHLSILTAEALAGVERQIEHVRLRAKLMQAEAGFRFETGTSRAAPGAVVRAPDLPVRVQVDFPVPVECKRTFAFREPTG